MDFSNPWVLAFLPLAFAPVILHLFFHRRRTRVDFSSLLFFEKRKHYFAFRRRLLEILLLICRVLILLLVIFALARPCFKRFSFLKNAGVEVVIVLDDTMSMQRALPGGTTAFEQARSQAETLLNTLSGEDGAGLVFISGKKGVAVSREKDAVLKAVRSASVTASSGSFGAAVSAAADQLERTPGVNREIHIFSDFQKTAAPLRRINSENLKKIRIFASRIGGPIENIAVTDVVPETAGCSPGVPVRIAYTMRVFSEKERTVRTSLEIGGQMVQTHTLTVQPGKPLRDAFTFVPSVPGRVEGFVSVADGSIPADDRIPFAFLVTEVAEVALAAQEDSADPWFYLRPAVDPRRDIPPLYGFRTVRISPRSLASIRPKQYAAVYLSPDVTLNREIVPALLKYLEDGGTLFLFPETGGGARFYRDLETYSGGKIPLLYEKTRRLSASGLHFDPPLHPLNEMLQLDMIRWNRVAPPLTPGGRVLARIGREPYIVVRRIGKGNLVTFGSGLRRSDSNWPELKSFPVVMLRILDTCLIRSGHSIQAECGALIGTDAETYTDSLGKTWKTENGRLRAPWMPSVLKLNGGSAELLCSVPAVRESDPEQLKDSGVSECFQQPVTLLEPALPVDIQIAGLRRGTELTGISLLLALLLTAVEFFLGAKPPVFRLRNEYGEDSRS